MSARRCPRCFRVLVDEATPCAWCGIPADPAGAAEDPKLTRAWVKCAACDGSGRYRDRNWLPWNNLASLAVMVGVTGLIAAMMDEYRKACLLGGFVSGALGIMLYKTGHECPRCEGKGGRYQPTEPASKATPTTPQYVEITRAAAELLPPRRPTPVRRPAPRDRRAATR